MELKLVIGLVALLFAVGSAGVIVFYFLVPRQQVQLKNLMTSTRGGGLGAPSEARQRMASDESGKEFERIKQQTRRGVQKKKDKTTLQDKLFQAGFYSPQEIQEYHRFRIICPIVATPLGAAIANYVDPSFTFIGLIFGFLVGLQVPLSMLDRKMEGQAEEILYYLPLVIEQVAIGVSSSLDIGPCISRIIQMADERDSHNAVTELLRQAQSFVRSGASLEEALMEVGKKAGHTELKHAFMALGQVAKHGGEITRQLQELADAVP